jgi:hypothetical protein
MSIHDPTLLAIWDHYFYTEYVFLPHLNITSALVMFDFARLETYI